MANSELPEVIISQHAATQMYRVAHPYLHRGLECGGHLYGARVQVAGQTMTFVMAAGTPGPKAVCTPASFTSDALHGEQWLRTLEHVWPDFPWVVIGEGHVHPMPLHRLSGIDIMALEDAAADGPYLAILLSNTGERLRLQAFISEVGPTGSASVRQATCRIDEELCQGLANLDDKAVAPISIPRAQQKVLRHASVNLRRQGLVVEPIVTSHGRTVMMYDPSSPDNLVALEPRKREGRTIWALHARSSSGWQDEPRIVSDSFDEESLVTYITHCLSSSTTVLAPSHPEIDVLARCDSWHVLLPQSLINELAEQPALIQASLRADEHWLSLDSIAPIDSGSKSDCPVVTWNHQREGYPELVRNEDGWQLNHGEQQTPVAVWNPADAGTRQQGLTALSRLQSKRVGLIGLGSMGSRLALHLAACDVQVLGADEGRFKAANAYPRYPYQRPLHQLVGRTKADILRQVEGEVLGSKLITTWHGNVVNDSVFEQHLLEFQPDLLIVSTDTLDSRRDIGALARCNGISQLHVGFADAAASVELAYYGTEERDPCPICRYGQQSQGGNGAALRPSSQMYAADTANDQMAVSALHASIELGAAVVSRTVVDLLAAPSIAEGVARTFRMGGQSGNLIWFSHQPDSWIFEDSLHKIVATIEKWSACPICGSGTHAQDISEINRASEEVRHDA
ncbi:MAG: hypothetical protein EA377_03405 [Phycisphaerales bacterium]|nr:MAG: hypothetical protein EA377_03405 [Phycisphaerales bacterium]